MKTMLQVPFNQYIRLMEILVYVDWLPSESLVSPKAFAELYEYSERQAIRDFALAAELGLPIQKVHGGYRKSQQGRFAVLPLIRASEAEIAALEQAAATQENTSISDELTHLAHVLKEMADLAPEDPPPAAAMELPQTSRLALLDEMLFSECGCSRSRIADALTGSQRRSVNRNLDHLRRLGAEVEYDHQDGVYYHRSPFYFGAFIAEPAAFHALQTAVDTASEKHQKAPLSELNDTMLKALETAKNNRCFDSYVNLSAAIRQGLDTLHAGATLPFHENHAPQAYPIAA